MVEAKKRGRFQSKSKKPSRGRGKIFFRKKFCKFCKDDVDKIDYKDVMKLKRFITEQGKILPNRITGNCAGHQRMVAAAIKRSRYIALLPYVAE